MLADQCEANFNEARNQHAAVAPKYTSQEDCQADFGDGRCEQAPYKTTSGGSVFMPLMMGYMMGVHARRAQLDDLAATLPASQQPKQFPHCRQPERRLDDGPDPRRQFRHKPSVF